MEFNQLSPQRASDAFKMHDRSIRVDITEVFESGDLEAYSIEYETSFKEHWIDAHQQHGSESDRHFQLKFVIADLLADLGHDIEVEIPDGLKTDWRELDREKGYNNCFEVTYSNGRADVAIFDDDNYIIGEVGRCDPKKLLNAGIDPENAVFLLLPYKWYDLEWECLETSGPISDSAPLQTLYEFSVEVAAFIKPEDDLSECLFA